MMKTGSLVALLIATAIASPLSAQETAGSGNATIVELGGAHTVGNPDAELTLTEYVSYTCSHCAHFVHDGEAALKLAYIPSGKVKVEFQSFLRNPIDVAASLLARCGDPARFVANHDLIMRNQPEWLATAQKANEAQMQRWSSGPIPQRMRAIASDLDFYRLMATNGYERPELDRCLADEAAIEVLIAQTRAAAENGVQGTPSFALNGDLLDGTHSWDTLRPKLDASLGLGPPGD